MDKGLGGPPLVAVRHPARGAPGALEPEFWEGLPWKVSRCTDSGLSPARTGGGQSSAPRSPRRSFLWRKGADGWGRRGTELPLGPGGAAVAMSGPMALSGLKLRGKDIGKPIEKGPRAK